MAIIPFSHKEGSSQFPRIMNAVLQIVLSAEQIRTLYVVSSKAAKLVFYRKRNFLLPHCVNKLANQITYLFKIKKQLNSEQNKIKKIIDKRRYDWKLGNKYGPSFARPIGSQSRFFHLSE